MPSSCSLYVETGPGPLADSCDHRDPALESPAAGWCFGRDAGEAAAESRPPCAGGRAAASRTCSDRAAAVRERNASLPGSHRCGRHAGSRTAGSRMPRSRRMRARSSRSVMARARRVRVVSPRSREWLTASRRSEVSKLTLTASLNHLQDVQGSVIELT